MQFINLIRKYIIHVLQPKTGKKGKKRKEHAYSIIPSSIYIEHNIFQRIKLDFKTALSILSIPVNTELRLQFLIACLFFENVVSPTPHASFVRHSVYVDTSPISVSYEPSFHPIIRSKITVFCGANISFSHLVA